MMFTCIPDPLDYSFYKTMMKFLSTASYQTEKTFTQLLFSTPRLSEHRLQFKKLLSEHFFTDGQVTWARVTTVS